MALVKYNNNSISAITAAAAIPSGAMTLIKEVTASASATVSFVNGSSDVVLDDTYPIYMFKFINIHPADDNADLNFQCSIDTGSNYNTTLTSSASNAWHNEGDATAVFQYMNEDQSQGTAFENLVKYVGNDNDQNASG